MKVFLALLILGLGCVGTGPPRAENPWIPADASLPAPQNHTVRIASFNIQVFGQTKLAKGDVMDVLAKTARKFDILLVQEIRDSSGTTLPAYLDRINNLSGPGYSAVLSPRLGRTSSKESYAYIYNTGKVRLLSYYTFADPPVGSEVDHFQREPFIARFLSGNSTFVLIGIHTDPDEAGQEIGDLALALDDARARYPDEDDFIILGDLNADCSYFGSDYTPLRNSSFRWIVPDSADTTTKTTDCAYDRIIIADSSSGDYAGSWGVFRFDKEYGLNQSFTEEVSDHYPVWADFRS